METIYAISHPITGERKYIGRTRHLKTRMWKHLNDSHNLKLRAWVSKLSAKGLTPVFEVLEVVARNEAPVVESKWITWAKHANPNMFNLHGFDPQHLAPKKIHLTLPPDTDKLINKLAGKGGCSRREIIIRAIKLLSEHKESK